MEDRQMLVNDEAKTAFCSVPKSGCTTLKVAFLLTLRKGHSMSNQPKKIDTRLRFLRNLVLT